METEVDKQCALGGIILGTQKKRSIFSEKGVEQIVLGRLLERGAILFGP